MADVFMPGSVPKATPVTQPFWDATKQHELQLQHCNACSRYYFYPRSSCRYCQSLDVTWRKVSGEATLGSFIINRKPLAGRDPQIIAMVDLKEGPCLLTNLIGIEPDPANLTLGMPLEVRFVDREDMVLPMFTKAGSPAL